MADYGFDFAFYAFYFHFFAILVLFKIFNYLEGREASVYAG